MVQSSSKKISDLYRVYSTTVNVTNAGTEITHNRNTSFPLVSFLDSSDNPVELAYKVNNSNKITIYTNKTTATSVKVIVGGGNNA